MTDKTDALEALSDDLREYAAGHRVPAQAVLYIAALEAALAEKEPPEILRDLVAEQGAIDRATAKLRSEKEQLEAKIENQEAGRKNLCVNIERTQNQRDRERRRADKAESQLAEAREEAAEERRQHRMTFESYTAFRQWASGEAQGFAWYHPEIGLQDPVLAGTPPPTWRAGNGYSIVRIAIIRLDEEKKEPERSQSGATSRHERWKKAQEGSES